MLSRQIKINQQNKNIGPTKTCSKLMDASSGNSWGGVSTSSLILPVSVIEFVMGVGCLLLLLAYNVRSLSNHGFVWKIIDDRKSLLRPLDGNKFSFVSFSLSTGRPFIGGRTWTTTTKSQFKDRLKPHTLETNSVFYLFPNCVYLSALLGFLFWAWYKVSPKFSFLIYLGFYREWYKGKNQF